MSKTISSVIVQLLVIILPLMGIEVGSEALTTTVQTIALLATGFVIYFERYKRGDVTVLGGRK